MPLVHKNIWFLAAVTDNASEKGKRISPSNKTIKKLTGEILQCFAI